MPQPKINLTGTTKSFYATFTKEAKARLYLRVEIDHHDHFSTDIISHFLDRRVRIISTNPNLRKET